MRDLWPISLPLTLANHRQCPRVCAARVNRLLIDAGEFAR